MIRDRITPDVDPANIRWPEDLQRDPEPARNWRRLVAVALGGAAVLALCISAVLA